MAEKLNRDRNAGNQGRNKRDRNLSGSKKNVSNPNSPSLSKEMDEMEENPRKGKASEKRSAENRDDSGNDEAN
jgi:hypothetical protein